MPPQTFSKEKNVLVFPLFVFKCIKYYLLCKTKIFIILLNYKIAHGIKNVIIFIYVLYIPSYLIITRNRGRENIVNILTKMTPQNIIGASPLLEEFFAAIEDRII